MRDDYYYERSKRFLSTVIFNFPYYLNEDDFGDLCYNEAKPSLSRNKIMHKGKSNIIGVFYICHS